MLRTISLTRGGDNASCLAALVKLFSSTTATKAVVSARLGACIGVPIIRKTGIAHEDYCSLPITAARVHLDAGNARSERNRNEQAQACHRDRKHPTQSLRRHAAQCIEDIGLAGGSP